MPNVHWQIEIICFIHFGKIISNRLKLQDIQVKIYFLFFFPELIYFIKMTFENTLAPSQDQNLPNHAVPYKINQPQYLIRLLIISRVNFCLKLMSQIPSDPSTQNLSSPSPNITWDEIDRMETNIWKILRSK